MLTNPENVEIINENLKRYFLHDAKIVVYEPIGAKRETVDMWQACTLETAQNWAENQAYHEIHDMRQSTITPYARHKAIELTQSLSEISGRAAIIISESHTGQLIGFFVNNVFNRFNKKRERKVFTTFEDALAWIEEVL